ncbi:MAG TPA: lipase maturation factor family protein [Thermoanaerobaculaceae bacterium]|nr:lipase maturation factor family protein [Thermoanaerobaculaceae bacterium]
MPGATHHLVRWLFLRSLGVVYLVAFASLATQVSGLIGRRGILPAAEFMQAAGAHFDARGVGAMRVAALPTLCWLSASDGFLRGLCVAGVVMAAAVVIGIAPAPLLGLLWLVYLSLVVVGRDFLAFQWDALLLETGLLAILFAPLQPLPARSGEAPPSRLVLWLLRWLTFRLMFGSGAVKLASGDPSWRNLTALTYHYQTQPLPNRVAWLAQQLPAWFQRASCAAMFTVELGAPLLIFAPRRWRLAGCAAMVSLQVLIAATGNYCFFNLLACTLCLTLLDDAALAWAVPAAWRERLARIRSGAPGWSPWLLAPVAALLFLVTSVEFTSRFLPELPWPRPLTALCRAAEPFRSTNSYGLFAVMTTTRPEIVVEGSDDGRTWRAYEFRYKPGDVRRAPREVAPFQPRLDWQMWFAALGTPSDNPWFVGLCVRLLEGSPEVLALLGRNPFPAAPPRVVRARLYDYRFSTLAELRADGAWWRRELLGDYLPAISLRDRGGAGELGTSD